MKIVTVTELNIQIKTVLENTFEKVSVEGEVSNLTYHSSGHIYFSIKDKNSTIKCVLFRGNAKKLKFRLEQGIKVVCHGAISVYTPRGDYQLNCFNINIAGAGDLAFAFEQLKNKLEKKGYFDKSRKKSLPKIPKKIAIVTSKTGAAIEDMIRVANKRWPLVKIILINTIVQGDNAKYEIANNIKYADSLDCDVIIVGRGGGSIEDLWAFNEEIVADAIFMAKTPIVSAVGHEIDYLISDFVADIRAATPSASMEIVLPDKFEAFRFLDGLLEQLNYAKNRLLEQKINLFTYTKQTLFSNHIKTKIIIKLNEIEELKTKIQNLKASFLNKKSLDIKLLFNSLFSNKNIFLQKKQHDLEIANQQLLSNNPKNKLISHQAQIVKNNKPISLDTIKKDDIFELIDSKYILKAKAIIKKPL